VAYTVFCFFVFLVVATSERLVSEMTYYVSSGTLNSTLSHLFTQPAITLHWIRWCV